MQILQLLGFPSKLLLVKPFRILIFILLLVALVGGARFLFQETLFPEGNNPSTVLVPTTPEPILVKASPSPQLIALSEEESAFPEIRILEEILSSKNDNDPRMDQSLKNFSEPVKSAIRKKYMTIPAEARNERGTIVFLIGRELSEGRGSTDDISFLKDVLLEKPCFNLEDCSKDAVPGSLDEEHVQGIHETTAMYPQLMDLRYLKLSLENGDLNQELKNSVLAALESARHSPNPRVVQEALLILQSYSKNH